MTERLRDNALRFISDFCSEFGEFMDIMDMRSFDVSYPYEYFLHNLTDADSHMFDCFEFEDDMWAGGSFTLTEYWKNAISYHGTVPFLRSGTILQIRKNMSAEIRRIGYMCRAEWSIRACFARHFSGWLWTRISLKSGLLII